MWLRESFMENVELKNKKYKKIFDISIAIDCLHEMDRKIVKISISLNIC